MAGETKQNGDVDSGPEHADEKKEEWERQGGASEWTCFCFRFLVEVLKLIPVLLLECSVSFALSDRGGFKRTRSAVCSRKSKSKLGARTWERKQRRSDANERRRVPRSALPLFRSPRSLAKKAPFPSAGECRGTVSPHGRHAVCGHGCAMRVRRFCVAKAASGG